MDRDLVLAGLVTAAVGTSLLVAGAWPQTVRQPASARAGERMSWRALWRPVLPGVILTSILIGWAIMEPAESDEPLPPSIVLAGVAFLALWVRVAVRAGHSLTPRPPSFAGTVGLWRPRVVVSTALRAQVDAGVLRAIEAHEAAHARHHDPLRIWLAQLVTDLQWPLPAAQRRFHRWRHTLELARDEEARLAGADGADLAAAVLLAVRLQAPGAMVASLVESECDLHERIVRLLAPVPSDERPAPRAVSALALFAMSLLGVMSGARFGDGMVRMIVRWLP